jgi:hypothetical protein
MCKFSTYPGIIRRNTETVSQISLKKKIIVLHFVMFIDRPPTNPHQSCLRPLKMPAPTIAKFPIVDRISLIWQGLNAILI